MQNKAEEKNADASGASQKSSQPAESSTVAKKSLWSKSWVYFVIMGLLTAVVFSQFIFSNGMLHSSDQMNGIDSKVFLKTTLQEDKQFPMWFNTRLSGMPTVDALFGDMFYLPSIVVNYLLPIHRAISWRMIIHIFLAGVFFFVLLRKGFKAHPLIALTGALIYMLNPQFFSHIYPGHDGKMFVIAWLPFIIWRMKRLVEIASFRNMSLLALGIGMCILTSHIQMTYFVLWGIFFYYLVAIVVSIVKKDNSVKPGMLSLHFWLAVIVGMGIGLIQIYPSMMYIRDAFSVRGVDRGFEFASSWSLHWPEAFSMFVPELVNTLEYYWSENPFKLNSEYVGSVALLLAVFAVIRNPSRWRILWISIAAFALLFSLGKHTFIFTIAYYLVPGVKKFRACSMIMFWFSFSIAILSTLFLKDILKEKMTVFSETVKKKWQTGIFITIGALFLLAVLGSNKSFVLGIFGSAIKDARASQVFDVNFSQNYLLGLWLWFIMAVISLSLIWAVVMNKVKPVTVIVIFLFMCVFDALRVDMQFVKIINPSSYFYSEPAVVDLRTKMKLEPFRCFSLPGAFANSTNCEGIVGLEGVSGFHDNELKWYREFRGDQSDRNFISSLISYNDKGQAFLNVENLSKGNPFLDIANAKYILARGDNGLVPIENKNALGRISFVEKYVILDTNKIADALQNGSYDYKTTIALFKEPLVKFEKSNGVSPAALGTMWEKYSSNLRKVKVDVPADGYLRISEVFYPAWKIKVDGKLVETMQADLAWMAIPVSKGAHSIEMKITSNYLGKVEWISVLIMSLYLLYGITFVVLSITKKKSLVPFKL